MHMPSVIAVVVSIKQLSFAAKAAIECIAKDKQ
jgi:hypothetical protein